VLPAPEVHPAILDWYADEGRPLAFRATRDPWAILVSEAMAQQTQAARAAEAWGRFLAAYPTPEAFAAASVGDALRIWRGLGYNRRALALREAARAIVERHGGVVPADLDALRALPGVGPYTARAVAALAFAMDVGAVDTNVRRVLGRLVAGAADALPPAELQRIADAAVPVGRAGEWTHALMDLGATRCKPRVPRCDACPVRPWCAYAIGRGAAADPAAASSPGTGAHSATRPGRADATPFRLTSRWLRGRILDALRDAEPGAWVALGGEAIGEHPPAAVEAAMDRLAAEGLLERSPDGARLPVA
jgi:A/G-specific adenine glycosylase